MFICSSYHYSTKNIRTVYIFWPTYNFVQDPWWNPAVEEQAVMRIHRIGQTKSVTIKRFIVKVFY